MKIKKLLPLLLVIIVAWFSQIVTAQTVVYDDSDGPFSLLTQVITVLSPNGGENWNGAETHNITWSAVSSITNVNIDYSTNSGSSWTPVAANIADSGTYAWTVPATPSLTCLVRVSDAANAATLDISDAVFFISASAVESVSAPTKPSGVVSGVSNTIYTLSSGGSISSLGHEVQYKFDWGDGTDSGWLAAGTASATHAWAVNGTYQVRAMARCATHTTVESPWSETLSIIISEIIPALNWNTFMGGLGSDNGKGIVRDSSGNIIIVGESDSTWGSPLHPYGSSDAFVVKLNAGGILQWQTFLGSSNSLYSSIAVDSSGNIFIAGYSGSSWGSPLNPFTGSGDAFVAKLNASGVLQWNTFLGGDSTWVWMYDNSIAIDSSGNIFITGEAHATWGSPVNPYSGGYDDAFVAKLDSNGIYQWHTFLGGSKNDYGWGVAVDSNGNVFVSGASESTWGIPLHPHNGSGIEDVFVAKLNSSGSQEWNTFIGSIGTDEIRGITLDESGNIIVTGTSNRTWGSPLNPYNGNGDAFVAKLNQNGAPQWNTFLGGSDVDEAYSITTDSSGNIYSTGSFGVAKLSANGIFQWNTFTQSASDISVDNLGNIFLIGTSISTWGSPLRPYSGSNDAFVAKLGHQSSTLTVASPNGGESWTAGSSQNITWDSPGTITNVNIDYSTNSGSSWTPVAANIANSGSYAWTVPATLSTTCLVRVSDAANAADYDVSDSTFDIVPAISLTATSPNGGENWTSGSAQNITWSSTGTIANVNIDYSANNGSNWNSVAANITNSGSYSWTVPGNPSTNCLVRISDAANAAIYDVSDAAFTISTPSTLTISGTITSGGTGLANVVMNGLPGNPTTNASGFYTATVNYNWSGTATPTLTGCTFSPVNKTYTNVTANQTTDYTATITPSLVVTTPNGGEQWQCGTTQNITWTSVGITNVKIELLKGTAVNLTITSSAPAASGSYSWAIPSSQTVATNYKIRITSTASSTVTDSSNATFSIFTPAITVTVPAASSVWARNTTKTIAWTKNGTMDANVKIQLYSGTTNTLDITLSTDNDGSYDWAIPSTLATGTYTVKITTVDNLVVGNSGSFSIVTGIITVTAPATGASWQRGVLHTITWTGQGTLNANVKIQLLKGTAVNLTIAATTPNDGSFDWTIPASQALATNYKIRIITVDSLVTGDSGAFAITNTSALTLQAPNGNERLAALATFPISWTVDPSMNEVKLEYSRDNGGTFFIIADHVPNSGQYSWRVPVNFTFNGIIRVSDSHGKNWLDEEGVLECLFKFSCSSQQEARQPDFAVWFGTAKITAPGYGFANVAIGRDMVRMAEASQAMAPLSSGWHEAKIRLDLKRDLGTLFIDDQRLLENVALYTSLDHHFEPCLSIQAKGGAAVDLLLADLMVQVTLLSAEGIEKDRFTILSEDFGGYDAERNVIGNSWQASGLKPDGPALMFKALPGTGQALRLQSTADTPVTISKPLAIPEKIPFDISDRSFIIEMRQGVD